MPYWREYAPAAFWAFLTLAVAFAGPIWAAIN
jgi:hypothetical protein